MPVDLGQYQAATQAFIKENSNDVNTYMRRAVAAAKELDGNLTSIGKNQNQGESPGMRTAREVRPGATPDQRIQAYLTGNR